MRARFFARALSRGRDNCPPVCSPIRRGHDQTWRNAPWVKSAVNFCCDMGCELNDRVGLATSRRVTARPLFAEMVLTRVGQTATNKLSTAERAAVVLVSNHS